MVLSSFWASKEKKEQQSLTLTLKTRNPQIYAPKKTNPLIHPHPNLDALHHHLGDIKNKFVHSSTKNVNRPLDPRHILRHLLRVPNVLSLVSLQRNLQHQKNPLVRLDLGTRQHRHRLLLADPTLPTTPNRHLARPASARKKRMLTALFQNFLSFLTIQVQRGTSAEKIALTLSLGVVIGIFPIVGLTAFFCLLLGHRFNLNHVLLQTVNQIVCPLQIVLVLFFVRAGEILYGASPAAFTFSILKQEFFEHPSIFFKRFGMLGIYAVSAWLIIAPFLFLALHFFFKKMIQHYLSVKETLHPHVS